MKHPFSLFLAVALAPVAAFAADPVEAILAGLQVDTPRGAGVPSSVAPTDRGSSGLSLEFLAKAEGLSGIKENSLQITECAEGEAAAPNEARAKSVKFVSESAGVSEDGSCARFTVNIAGDDALRLAKALKFKGTLVAYGKGETESTSVAPLPAVGAPSLQLGRFRLSCRESTLRTQPGFTVQVDGPVAKFKGLVVKAGETELKEIRRSRTGGLVTVYYPAPAAGEKLEVSVVSWKSREEIPVNIRYGE